MGSVHKFRPGMVAATGLIGILVAGCSSSDVANPVSKSSAEFASNGAKLVRGSAEVTPADDDRSNDADGPKLPSGAVTFVDAEYEVSVRISAPDFGVRDVALPCQSRVRVRVNVSLDSTGSKDKILDFPEGSFDCGALGKLDVKTLLGVVAQALPSDAGSIQVSDNVIAVKEISKGKFDPPRPIFPSFIAASNKDLSSINMAIPSAKFTTAKGTYSGSYGLTVDFAGQTEAAPGTADKQLKRLMQFTMTSSGFAGTDKLAALLVDKMRIKMNVVPISIPSMEIRAVAGELFTTDALRSGKVGEGLIGTGLEVLKKLSPDGVIINALKRFPVDMKLTLIKQEGLDEAILRAEANAAKVSSGRVTVD